MSVITYKMIRDAMENESYPMSLTGESASRAIVEAVNQGIDSHLEACNSPERGDYYSDGDRRVGDKILVTSLECDVSVESFPVLLRRLQELGDKGNDAAEELLSDILMSLDLPCDTGCFEIISPVDEKGREDDDGRR